MKLTDIEARMAEINAMNEVEMELEELKAINEEYDTLAEERKGIMEQAEKRKAEIQSVVETVTEPIHEFKEERSMEKAITKASEEYRIAYLKNLQGKELDDVEKRALTATAALPEQTANKIIDRMVDMVPLLNEIELFRVPGNVNIAVETVAPAGKAEAAGGAVTEATATLRQVALGGYNVNAFISVGADLAAMAVSAFEDWLVRKLSEAIAYKIEDFIVNGDGNSAPTGIEKYATWDVGDGTGVDWTGSSGSALAVTDLDSAIGLLPAAYDSESKFLMSKKTFYTNVANLTDVNNFPVVQKEGKTFLIRGYEVIFSDKVAANDIFFGSFKRGMVGNLSADIKVEKQRNLRYNAMDFLGWGVFDCAPAAAGCIIKIASDIPA